MTTNTVLSNWDNLQIIGPVTADSFVGPITGVVNASTLKVTTATPASAAATGVAGTIVWDASYIYVCTATNTWKRVAIATW